MESKQSEFDNGVEPVGERNDGGKDDFQGRKRERAFPEGSELILAPCYNER